MPRLVGKQSNSGLWTSVVLVAAIAVAAAGGIEYLGYTNFIPGWGKNQKAISQGMMPTTAIFSPVSPAKH